MKRFFDIIFSLSVLVFSFPLFIFISLGIWFFSPGKIFYTQIRLGKNGKPFKCYKFRTMHFNADQRLRTILQQNPDLEVEWKKNQKLKCDPRIIFFGRWLRKTSLDELPQFWNVLKGNLSVVGPRPYMANQRNEIGEFSSKIFSIKPGITGLWQTSGRSNTTFRERIALDAAYIDQQSFLYDLWLILKTIPKIFFPNNAY